MGSDFEKTYMEEYFPADDSVEADVRALQHAMTRLFEKTKLQYFESLKADVCNWEQMLHDSLKARWGFKVKSTAP